MADDDDGVLPAYIEVDEEETAAAKMQRREQSKKPPVVMPWCFTTPEEKANFDRRQALEKELFEYDPKAGYGAYTRAHFLDLTTFDLDEETQYGPMRFTDSIIGDDHMLSDSLNILCLKIMSSDVGYPINVYGTVIVRDPLDYKCVNIFKRDRINCQLVQSENEDLILSGPTRGVVFLGAAFFEINLKIKEDEECKDRQFSKAFFEVFRGKINSKVQSSTHGSWLSTVQLVYSLVKKALEGTIEIKILSGPDVFHGKMTACTTDVPNDILLYDSDVVGAMAVGDGGTVQLLRRVVAVSEDEMLIFNINARDGDHDGNIWSTISKFTPMIKGGDEDKITCGPYKMRVKVVWSTLYYVD